MTDFVEIEVTGIEAALLNALMLVHDTDPYCRAGIEILRTSPQLRCVDSICVPYRAIRPELGRLPQADRAASLAALTTRLRLASSDVPEVVEAIHWTLAVYGRSAGAWTDIAIIAGPNLLHPDASPEGLRELGERIRASLPSAAYARLRDAAMHRDEADERARRSAREERLSRADILRVAMRGAEWSAIRIAFRAWPPETNKTEERGNVGDRPLSPVETLSVELSTQFADARRDVGLWWRAILPEEREETGALHWNIRLDFGRLKLLERVLREGAARIWHFGDDLPILYRPYVRDLHAAPVEALEELAARMREALDSAPVADS